MIGLVLAIAGIVLAGVIVVTALYFQHQRQKLWHETARVALEKGQPLPPGGPDGHDSLGQPRRADGRHDLRAGLILLGVGAGLFMFFPRQANFIGAIPAFVGVALLIYAAIAAIAGRRQN